MQEKLHSFCIAQLKPACERNFSGGCGFESGPQLIFFHSSLQAPSVNLKVHQNRAQYTNVHAVNLT